MSDRHVSVTLHLAFRPSNRFAHWFIMIPFGSLFFVVGCSLCVVAIRRGPIGLLFLIPWTLFAAAFVWVAFSAATYRIEVDSEGLLIPRRFRVPQPRRMAVKLCWNDIDQVSIRGDTNRHGHYRKVKLARSRSIMVNGLDTSNLTRLLIVLKCFLDAKHSVIPISRETADLVGLRPVYWNSVVMPEGFDWADTEWIVMALHEAFPCIDPASLPPDAIARWATQLKAFKRRRDTADTAEQVERIRRRWCKLYDKHRGFAAEVVASVKAEQSVRTDC